MKSKQELIQDLRNRNDEYLHTVYAIIGFLNTYKYELKKTEEVLIFQGRKLFVDEKKDTFVTPDYGLVLSEKNGLVGEVKYSFPADQDKWKEIFEQIHKYDNILRGWPCEDQKVEDYDIVLLVHQARARRVVDYYIQSIPDQLKLKKTFAIIEFNHSSQGKEYFNFRIEYGKLSNNKIHEKFYNGLPVPFDIYITQYAKIRIYDVQPPLPFLLHLIYESILDKLKREGQYRRLTKKTKIALNTSIKEVTHVLREVYSFKGLQSKTYDAGQPEFPKQQWIRVAVNKLIQIGEAVWTDQTKGTFSYYLSAKEINILDYYIEKCVEQNVLQPELNFNALEEQAGTLFFSGSEGTS